MDDDVFDVRGCVWYLCMWLAKGPECESRPEKEEDQEKCQCGSTCVVKADRVDENLEEPSLQSNVCNDKISSDVADKEYVSLVVTEHRLHLQLSLTE